jgi:TRAP transporter 4TM/12TM fusion protein
MEKPKVNWTPVGILALILAGFHLYTSGAQILPTVQQRGIHLGLILAIIFLTFPYRKRKDGKGRGIVAWVIDYVLAALALFLGYYMYSNHLELSFVNSAKNDMMWFAGAVSILLTLEASRRVLGWTLPILSLLAIAYVLFGDRLPLSVAHSGFTMDEMIASIGLSTQGIIGQTLGISATFIILFVIFGSMLEKSGAGQFFIDLALSVFGRFRGGSAKVAVASSALFGSISGSPVANAATTGVITIPLMKKGGYAPQYAAAVEAAASTGGMILPPVMGAASFLIADFLQIPYTSVLSAAIFPALLYFISIFIMVDLNAAKKIETSKKAGTDASGEDPGYEIKSAWTLIKANGHLMLPLLVLIYLLTIAKFTTLDSAFWAIVSIPVVALLKKSSRMSVSSILYALQDGIRSTLGVAAACASAGIVVGAINMTGIGLRFSSVLIEWSGGHLLIMLVLTMVASIILGMGLPAVAAYVVLAVLAAPAITSLGVDPLAAHLFIFYFGTLSSITPPLAIAAFTTAGIAKTSPFKTGFIATRLALVAFVVPFMFVYGNELLLKGSFLSILISIVTSVTGIYVLSVALEGYMKGKVLLVSRVILLISALLLLNVGWVTDVIGVALAALVILYELRRSPTPRPETAT